MKETLYERNLPCMSPEAIEKFASEISRDPNYIHTRKAGKRQILPGDALISMYFSATAIQFPSHYTFKFEKSVPPDSPLRVIHDSHSPESEIYRQDNGNRVATIERNLDSTLLHTYQLNDPSPPSSHHSEIADSLLEMTGNASQAYLSIVGEYDLCSEDMFKFFSEEELSKLGVSLTPRTLPVFTGASLTTTPEICENPESLYRVMNTPSVDVKPRGDKASAELLFSFPLYSGKQAYESGDSPVGLITKEARVINLSLRKD